MSRLIDADLLEEILDVNIQILQDNIDDARTEVQKIVYEAQEFSTMEMIRVIKEQPTAFDKKIYNKAIDDFADKICTYGTYDDYGNVIDILEIAEKLKAGKINE